MHGKRVPPAHVQTLLPCKSNPHGSSLGIAVRLPAPSSSGRVKHLHMSAAKRCRPSPQLARFSRPAVITSRTLTAARE